MKHLARAFLLTFLFVVVFGVQGVSAETRTTCEVPAQYATIQSAVDNYCQIINIAAGIYYENVQIQPSAEYYIALNGSGREATIIDGGGNGTTIMAAYKELTVKDLTIRNGYSASGGGLSISSISRVSVYNVLFENNVSTGYGGAFAGTMDVYNGYLGIGIEDSEFRNNSAAYGGAVSIKGNEQTGVSMVRNRFINNTATNNGGAIFASTRFGSGGSYFDGNSAANCGGVIYFDREVGDFHSPEQIGASISGTILNNSAASGGVGCTVDGSLAIQSSTVAGNSAFNDGGVLAVYGTGQGIISRSLVRQNEAGNVGGAIVMRGESAELIVTSTAIEENKSTKNGGGIYIETGSATLNDLSLTNNRATDGDGGALYSKGNIVLTDSGISHNSALLGGGVAFNQGQFTVDRVGFENNTATYFGGGVFVNWASSLSSIEDFAISGNTAQNGGGLFVNGDPRLNIARGLFAENTATGSGGGIDGNVNLNQVAVVNNNANDSGGGARTNDSRFINVTISNNSAGFAGSGLVADGLLASYTTIADNFGSPAIFNPTDGPIPVQFEHTVISNPATQNCAGESVQAIGVNTIDSDGSCNFDASRALSNIDPMLEPLAMNGGSSPTHALQAGSPAIGMGYDCPEYDQRGGVRQAGNCDLGAYQTNASIPTAIALTTQAAQTSVFVQLMPVVLAVSLLTLLTVAVCYRSIQRRMSQGCL